MIRVLVFEPDNRLGIACRQQLEKQQLWVVHCSDPALAIELFKKQVFHLVLWDLEGSPHFDALLMLKQIRPTTSVIGMHSQPHAALVVDTMRKGASNFWVKQPDLALLEQVVTETVSRFIPDEPGSVELESMVPGFLGRHPKILEIFQLIMSIRSTDSTVLITGESGTGKEVVARAIHQLSNRHKAPWVAVNCAAIPANLLESELFGHVKGAFTGAISNRMGRFQLAGSGTLFLDEISDLSLELQSKLLRAIQMRQYEPVGSPHSLTLESRIIAATNQCLDTAVNEKRFRQDLFYRLNVIPIVIPPLRARKTDIPLLARHFLEKFHRQCSREFVGISEEAMRALIDYQWPGNVRELENLMERVVVLKRSEGLIEIKDLPIQHFSNVRVDRFVANVAIPEDGINFNDAVNEFENELILQALQKTNGNKNKAASLLNLNRTTLVEKLKRKNLRILGSQAA